MKREKSRRAGAYLRKMLQEQRDVPGPWFQDEVREEIYDVSDNDGARSLLKRVSEN